MAGVSPRFSELFVVRLFIALLITVDGTPDTDIPCCSIVENNPALEEPDILNLYNPLPNCNFVLLVFGSTFLTNFLFVFIYSKVYGMDTSTEI